MKEILIDDRYRLVRKIADGGLSTVFIGMDINSGEEVAVKLENECKMGWPVLHWESEMYEILAGPGIPRMRWFGDGGIFNVLISDLLGPSIHDLFEFCDRKFSLKTVLLLADQMICRIKYIHSKYYLHQDIKPDNFLMGAGRLGNLVHIIDFGISREYMDDITKKHKPYCENECPIGTMPYISLNAHLGITPSRRDDLESLGYVLIYLLRGSLPWLSSKGSIGVSNATISEINRIMKGKKMECRIEDLCDGLPTEFVTYMHYVRNLEFEARPNYTYLRRIFSLLFARRGYKYDNIFDWTLKEFSILHQPPTVAVEVDQQPEPEPEPDNHSQAGPSHKKAKKAKKAKKPKRVQGGGVNKARRGLRSSVKGKIDPRPPPKKKKSKGLEEVGVLADRIG